MHDRDEKLGQRLQEYLESFNCEIQEGNRMYSPYVFHVDVEVLTWFLNTVSGRGLHLPGCVSQALMDWVLKHS